MENGTVNGNGTTIDMNGNSIMNGNGAINGTPDRGRDSLKVKTVRTRVNR